MTVMLPVRTPVYRPVWRLGARHDDSLFSWEAGMGLPDLTFSRTSAATQTGDSLVEYASDVPRLSNGWLIEGGSTNEATNPRAEGATAGVIGSGGAWPTGWTGYGDTGLTATIVHVSQDDGIDYIRVRLSGTTDGSTGFYAIAFLAAGELTGLSQNDPVSSAVFLRLVDDTDIDDVTQIVIDHNEQNSGPSYLSTNSSADFLPSLTSSFQRFRFANDTMDEATVDSVQAQVGVGLNTSAAVDITFDIGVPTTEEAAHVSSPILPAVSSPAASDRTAEVAEYDFGAGVLASQFSFLAEFSRPSTVVPSGLDPRVVEFSNSATDSASRIMLWVLNGGPLRVNAHNSGPQQASAFLGNIAADVTSKAAVTVDVTGATMRGSLDGATVAMDSGGTFVQPRYMGIGQAVTANNHLYGTLRRLTVWKHSLSNAELQALST